MSKIRLDKLLSNMGRGSRKELKFLLRQGAAAVDGAVVKDGGMLVDPAVQSVTFYGEPVAYRPTVYLMMNKPAGVLSATEDARGDAVAVDLVGEEYAHYALAPAGRLDRDSEGFLLLTNDGGFVHEIITPNRNVEKLYYCVIQGEAEERDIVAFAKGIRLLDGTQYLPAVLRWDIPEELERYTIPILPGQSHALVTICEGKFHQVKRMFLSCRKNVLYLKRISIGGVWLDETLLPGGYRELTDRELTILRNREDRNEQTDNK